MGRTLQIETPPVFAPLLEPARYKGAYGGRGSGKSHYFAESLIEHCIVHPGTRAVCVREVQQSLEQSVKRLLEDKIVTFGAGAEFRVLNTHIETPGDGIIIFQGMSTQTRESIKSLEGYSVAWVEEAQSLSQRSLDLLRPTIRMERCRYCYREGPIEALTNVACEPGHNHALDPSEIWFSWNPRLATDPIDNFLRGTAERPANAPPWKAPPDSVVVEASYRDNPWFPDVLRREMEWDLRNDPDKYAHVWLGGYERHSEARVFRNWVVEEFDTPPDSLFYLGGDWGFSADPTVIVRLWVEQARLPRARLNIDYEAYRVGCEIDHTPALFDSVPGARDWPFIADSARPETISYLNRHGFPRLIPAHKGKDSVKEGIIFLQGYDIRIHPRCIHTIDEFTHYSYKKNPLTDEITPILEDKKNHVIDAVRYAVERLRANIFDYREAGMTSEVTW